MMTTLLQSPARMGALLASSLAVLISAGAPPSRSANQPLLGNLPPGPVSALEVRDVQAELCQTLIFLPAASPVPMPSGYRLATLSEKASAPAVAALLRQRPELSAHARGAFCFINAGSYELNGKPLYAGRQANVAFFWADMVPIGKPPADPRFRGDLRRMQLLWVYDRDGLDRDLLQSVQPDALLGDIVVEKRDGSWFASIKEGNSSLQARVTPITERKALSYPMPGFETLPLADVPGHFAVVTFAGHHEQQATGEWLGTGTAPWARVFADAGSVDGGSFIQDGFAARVAVYRAKPPPR